MGAALAADRRGGRRRLRRRRLLSARSRVSARTAAFSNLARGQQGWIPTASRHRLLRLRLELAAEASSVRVARAELANIATHCGADVAGVQLCVSEAVSNAVVHAYRGRDRDDTDPATVRVAADVEQGVLRVIVEDDGVGPSPRLDSPGLGIGLALIAATASEAEISARSPTGARVCMQFATSSA